MTREPGQGRPSLRPVVLRAAVLAALTAGLAGCAQASPSVFQTHGASAHDIKVLTITMFGILSGVLITVWTLLALVLIASGAIIGWTTRLGDVAPALQRMIGPLRRLRMPVDEWIVAIALAIRCLPLLIDESRTLNAARRLRTHDEHGNPTSGGRTTRGLIDESLDLLAAAIVASVRRARDLAEAIIARGGTGGSVSEGRSAPGVLDWFVLAGAAALYGVSLAVLHL